MTIRSNANNHPSGGVAMSKQSGMQVVPGSERSSSQVRVGKHFGPLPRNLTPNLQTASRLKSPDLARHTQMGTARRDSSSGLQIEGHEAGLQQQLPPDQSRTNRQLPGPSTTIFVNETSLINKDLDMVEAAANCVKQRSIGLQQSRAANQKSAASHLTKTQTVSHATVQAPRGFLPRSNARAAKKHSIQRQQQTGQTDELSKDSQKSKLSKRPSDQMVLQGVPS